MVSANIVCVCVREEEMQLRLKSRTCSLSGICVCKNCGTVKLRRTVYADEFWTLNLLHCGLIFTLLPVAMVSWVAFG